MGRSLSVYLGPYLKCERREKQYVIEHRGCVNAECGFYHTKDLGGRHKFCSACGRAIGPWQETKIEKASHLWELMEATADNLYGVGVNDGGIDDDFDYFIPNKGGRCMHFDFVDPKVLPFDEKMNQRKLEELEWFNKVVLADNLQTAVDLYGGKVEVCWGLISWSD